MEDLISQLKAVTREFERRYASEQRRHAMPAYGQVMNVPAYPVDPPRLVYSFGRPGKTVITLYERGMDVFTYDGDFEELPSETPPSGHYRTCRAHGLVQMGASPVGPLTVDIS